MGGIPEGIFETPLGLNPTFGQTLGLTRVPVWQMSQYRKTETLQSQMNWISHGWKSRPCLLGCVNGARIVHPHHISGLIFMQHEIVVWQRYWPDIRITNWPSMLLCFRHLVRHLMFTGCIQFTTDPVKFGHCHWLLLVIGVRWGPFILPRNDYPSEMKFARLSHIESVHLQKDKIVFNLHQVISF